MTFIECVNRILRKNGYLQGDTDELVDFSSLQHHATMNMAIIAVQEAIGDLMADEILPSERVSATLALSPGTRTYALPSDFQQFWHDEAFFLEGNAQIVEFPGGERQLQIDFPEYRTDSGYPSWWYWIDGAVATVGFFQVPDAAYSLAYDYQKAILPTSGGNVLPFSQDTQAVAFTEMASIRFESTYAGKQNQDVQRLPAYISAHAKVLKLIAPTQASKRYGSEYV